jgi:hypothetical protein
MSSMQQRWLAAGLVVIVVGVVAYRQWTYPPAVEFDNLRYIQLLSTAVSSRKLDLVDKVAAAIADRHSDGQMSASERGHFDRLIELARTEQWDAADRACFAFAEAQLSRRRSRAASESGHDHDHHDHAAASAKSSATVATTQR